MDNNLKPYVKITDDQIDFNGETDKEKELNKWLYHTTLELNRYQDMTKAVFDYILKHQDIPEMKEVYNIIRDFNC